MHTAVVQCVRVDQINSAATHTWLAVKLSCQMLHIVWSKSDSREQHLRGPDSTINTALAISKGILGYGIKFRAIWLIMYGTVSQYSVQSLKLLPTNSLLALKLFSPSRAELDVELNSVSNTSYSNHLSCWSTLGQMYWSLPAQVSAAL